MHYFKLGCNPCKRMDAFKTKHNFYYENINNQSDYFKKKIAHNTCIHMNTFKFKHNLIIEI